MGVLYNHICKICDLSVKLIALISIVLLMSCPVKASVKKSFFTTQTNTEASNKAKQTNENSRIEFTDCKTQVEEINTAVHTASNTLAISPMILLVTLFFFSLVLPNLIKVGTVKTNKVPLTCGRTLYLKIRTLLL